MGFCSAAEPWCRLGYDGKVSCPMLCCGQVVSITLLLFCFVLFFFLLRKLQTPIIVTGKSIKRMDNHCFQKLNPQAPSDVLDTLSLLVFNS